MCDCRRDAFRVDWTVEGTHPLARRYRSKKEFLDRTFAKLMKVLPEGAQLYLVHVLVSGDWATVELRSMATAKNGLRFDNMYCWVTRFVDDEIVEVRAYLDSALVQRLFDETRSEHNWRVCGDLVAPGRERTAALCSAR